MKKLLNLILVIFITACMSSCGKDTYFKCFLYLKNSTGHNVYVEESSVNLATIFVEELNRIVIGETDRHIGEDYPPETFVTEKLQNIRIYREINDTIQELPRYYYDNTDDFTLKTDFFMGIYEIYYCLNITDEMFEE